VARYLDHTTGPKEQCQKHPPIERQLTTVGAAGEVLNGCARDSYLEPTLWVLVNSRRMPDAWSLRPYRGWDAVAGGPPHRSVLEELLHTAPPSGQTIAALLIADTSRDFRAIPIDVESDSEFGTSVTTRQYFPLVTSFPRRTPPLRSQFCSPVSSVVRSHLTSHRRSSQPCPRRGSLSVLALG
jgi:hypothetical protein